MNQAPNLPALVPAAGESRRMGRPKLLIEFGGVPLISRVVAALRDGGAEPVLVIAPPPGSPEGPAVAEAARAAGARVIAPAARPSQMRGSIELGLAELARESPPAAVLLTPGDFPALTARVVEQVLRAWSANRDRIVVACAGGKRAHPVVLPWDLAALVAALPADAGVNSLVDVRADRVAEVEVGQPGLDADLNTPADLERWSQIPPARFALRLFAIARERAGRAEVEVELALPATVADLRRAIAEQHPALAPLAPRVLVAIDSDYASDDCLIPAGANLALIPPVSGGQGAGLSR